MNNLSPYLDYMAECEQNNVRIKCWKMNFDHYQEIKKSTYFLFDRNQIRIETPMMLGIPIKIKQKIKHRQPGETCPACKIGIIETLSITDDRQIVDEDDHPDIIGRYMINLGKKIEITCSEGCVFKCVD